MGIWDNVRTDLRLRNLTIYAQWASVLAAMLLYLLAIPELFFYFKFLFSLPFNAMYMNYRILLNTLYIGVMSFLFPLAPLALDLPQCTRRKLFLYASTVSWFAIPLRLFCLLIVRIPERFIEYSINACLFAVTGTILSVTIKNSLWLRTRLGVNILYCGQLVFSTYIDYVLRTGAARYGWLIWFKLWVHCIAAGMFGVAALLCGIAWVIRHTWVSSRLLGGTGIEPMLLMLPGSGPLHQSVGDEAREGAIRLE